MIVTALILATAAVALGLGLAALALRDDPASLRRHPSLGLLHGALGLAAFVALTLTLRGPPRGLRTGTGSFGLIALILFGAAITLGGLILLWYRRRRTTPSALIAAHAGAAIAGFTMLLAWAGLD